LALLPAAPLGCGSGFIQRRLGGSAALPGTYGDELGRDRRVDDETGDITLGGLRVHTQSK
jgi:hypothetical protein